MSLFIPVVLGSVRESRLSEAPAKYIVEKIKALGHNTKLVDFKVLPLPFIDVPKEPHEYNKQYPNENVQLWSGIADAADGFVLVTPEYNHGYPAVLKNALDWLYYEFEHKPVGLVGVSNGLVGGARVIEQLRTIAGNFGLYDVRETVMFRKTQDVFDAEGKLLEPKYDKQIDTLLAQVVKFAELMKSGK